MNGQMILVVFLIVCAVIVVSSVVAMYLSNRRRRDLLDTTLDIMYGDEHTLDKYRKLASRNKK